MAVYNVNKCTVAVGTTNKTSNDSHFNAPRFSTWAPYMMREDVRCDFSRCQGPLAAKQITLDTHTHTLGS
jgi:hypothetical protein